MKKTTRLLMILLVCSALTTPAMASDTQDITTVDKTKTQEGTVYGSLSGTALTQLKVAIPIKLEFAVAPASTEEGWEVPDQPNKFFNGDYKIKVASDSEVGVQLDNINLKKIGKWILDTKENVALLNADWMNADQEMLRTISMNLGGKEMELGDNTFPANEFIVPVSGEKSLGMSGSAGRVVYNLGDVGFLGEQAFTITYTVSQK